MSYLCCYKPTLRLTAILNLIKMSLCVVPEVENTQLINSIVQMALLVIRRVALGDSWNVTIAVIHTRCS